jgi:hypothetical protein
VIAPYSSGRGGSTARPDTAFFSEFAFKLSQTEGFFLYFLDNMLEIIFFLWYSMAIITFPYFILGTMPVTSAGISDRFLLIPSRFEAGHACANEVSAGRATSNSRRSPNPNLYASLRRYPASGGFFVPG